MICPPDKDGEEAGGDDAGDLVKRSVSSALT